MRAGVLVTTYNRHAEAGTPCIMSLRRNLREDDVILQWDNGSPCRIREADIYEQSDNNSLTLSWEKGARRLIEAGCERIIFANHDIIVGPDIINFINAITEDKTVYGPLTNNPGHAGWQYGIMTFTEPTIINLELKPGVMAFVNGFFWGMTVKTLEENRHDDRHFFNPELPFRGNEDEFQARLRLAGGRAHLIRSCFVFHQKFADWNPTGEQKGNPYVS